MARVLPIVNVIIGGVLCIMSYNCWANYQLVATVDMKVKGSFKEPFCQINLPQGDVYDFGLIKYPFQDILYKMMNKRINIVCSSAIPMLFSLNDNRGMLLSDMTKLTEFGLGKSNQDESVGYYEVFPGAIAEGMKNEHVYFSGKRPIMKDVNYYYQKMGKNQPYITHYLSMLLGVKIHMNNDVLKYIDRSQIKLDGSMTYRLHYGI